MSRLTTLLPVFLLAISLIPDKAHAEDSQAENAQIAASVSPYTVYGKRYSRNILRGVHLKDVYEFNSTSTTPYGPAYANILAEPTNFVSCKPPSGRPFSYALCYYSGPPYPTGLASNPALPCKMSADGTYANCTCYAITTDATSPKQPYYVDINAISNLSIYQQTVEACGQDGAKCQTGGRVAPVCDALSTNLMVPGADLVSVYSPLFLTNYDTQGGSNSTSCTGKNQGLYAGCMTAPCTRTGEYDANGNELVSCKCPVFTGPYQIGQGNQNCNANQPPPGNDSSNHTPKGKFVWSAAYNVQGSNPTPPKTPCVPDSAGGNGCPLYDPAKDYSKEIAPGSAICTKVCNAYKTSAQTKTNAQAGYTCDSTLCTTMGIGQPTNGTFNPTQKTQAALSFQACNGLKNINGIQEIMLVETLAGCSCCASQVCGCDGPDEVSNAAIYDLNQEQRNNGIVPQCDINGTLCGKKP